MQTSGPDVQRLRDEQHLNLLAIFYYIYAGFTGLGACAGILYVFLGMAIVASPEMMENDEAAAGFVGGLLTMLGGCVVVFVIAMAALIAYAGVCLSRHQRYIYCMVIAAIICLSIPIGTILGVFTFVVLARPSVKALFEQSA